ncbi:Glycoside hydrolase, family 81 [Artemisia annua]|uniref:Glycoside hydrolase, family 81 n=1 Tax=Artemisia annua TaxID=35608 RepID=A0A2U1LTY2_ARTAN|nr:Glycoside hydrolase, family 81 [Artemisia annua]
MELTEFANRRNQESTSEAINAYYSLALMGLAYGDTYLVVLVEVLWANKRVSGLWFAPSEWKECRTGIQVLPLLPIGLENKLKERTQMFRKQIKYHSVSVLTTKLLNSEFSPIYLTAIHGWPVITGLCTGPSWSYISSIGVGPRLEEVRSFARLLKCKGEVLPFKYLGLLVSANMRKVSSWKTIIDKFQSKLSLWKAKMLSFRGRLVLIKSVMSNLPKAVLALDLYKLVMLVYWPSGGEDGNWKTEDQALYMETIYTSNSWAIGRSLSERLIRVGESFTWSWNWRQALRSGWEIADFDKLTCS